MRDGKGIATTTAVIIAVVIAVIVIVPIVYFVTTTAAPAAPKKLKMAFITTSDETDLGWSASAIEAADYVKIKYDAQTDVTRWGVLALGDTPRIIRDYVSAGYDLIWLNGAEFSVYAVEPATEAPNVKFVAVNPPFKEEETPPNVIGLFERSDEAQYLAGVVAGHMTKTNSIGQIIGENYLPLHLESLAYEAGAKSVNPNVRVSLVYAGTWIDATLGYTLAKAMIEEQNVDVIDQVADVTGRGVISAVVEKNIWIIGCYGDQASWAPNNTLTSYELDYGPALDIFMEVIAQGKWDQYGGKFWNLGLATGTGYLVPFTFFIDQLVPADVKAHLEQLTEDIKSGQLQVPGDAVLSYPNLLPP